MGKSANINQITVRGPRGGMRRNQNRRARIRSAPRAKRQQFRPRTNADQILAQGTGATVRKPFGGKGHKLGPGLACWDAKSPIHLALPRAVADYTIIRLTKRIKSSAVFNMFGTYMEQSNDNGYDKQWTNVCCVTDVNSALPINSAGNYRMSSYNISSFGTSLTWVPSAFTVQAMNGNPIGTTDGIVYAAVMTTQLDLLNNTQTWDDIGDNVVEYMNPRVLSAGKLALRGVQASSRPFNMSQVSDFTSVTHVADNSIGLANSHAPHPTGWAPVVFYNPEGSLSLEYLVTTEFRVRFNIENPACASHSHHPIHDDKVWDNLMKRATSMGNGIIDIADVVASTGQALGRAYKYASAGA
jgi:hypothetical protein